MKSTYLENREIPSFDADVSQLFNERHQPTFKNEPPKNKVGICNHKGEIYRVIEPQSMGEYIGFCMDMDSAEFIDFDNPFRESSGFKGYDDLFIPAGIEQVKF